MNEIREIASYIFKFDIGNTNFRVTLDNTFYSDGKTSKPNPNDIHYHSEYELFILTSGKVNLHLNNSLCKKYANCIIIVPPFLNHYSIRTEGDTYRLIFTFSQKKGSNGTTKTYQFFKRFFTLSSFSLKKEPIQYYCDTIRTIIYNIKKDRFSEEKISLLLKLIICEFIPIASTDSQKVILDQSYLLKIEDIIFNNFTEKITLEQLAKSLHLSSKQTSRILQRNFHKTLSELVTDKKMFIACNMLIETDAKISKIVEDLNFNSESYFFRLFKKYYGCSPIKYRQEHKIKFDSTKSD